MKRKRWLFLVGTLLFLGAVVLTGVYYYQRLFKDTIAENINAFYGKAGVYFPRLLIIVFIIFGTKLLLHVTDNVLHKYFHYMDMEREYYSFFTLVKYLSWFIAILASVSIFFGNIGAWLTSLGLMGFGITFALQKPILNFVGWLTILFVKTYTLEDRISINGLRGDVVEIRMMYTVLDGLLENSDELSGKTITVPNEMVLTSAVVNFTKTGYFVWDEVSVQITYESDWKAAFTMLEDITQRIMESYLEGIRPKIISHHHNLVDLFHELRKQHSEEEDEEKKTQLHHQLKQIHHDKEKAASDREKINSERFRKPIVRVALLESAVELNVRYLAYYKNLRSIKSDIYHTFLDRTKKRKDIEIAYPHLQLVVGKEGRNILR
ncbi:MAG: mechanosensitive ion channel [DPANN group archaeon]|nr:mechanosensitive ion channel [DPANN group archaeon]